MLLERLEPGKIVDRHGTIFETFMLMFHEGAQCLKDVRHLRKERPPVELTGSGSLPCSGFRANAAYQLPSAIACNLPCLMRQLLPVEWYGKRAVTFRHRLYAMAGQVAHYARQRILKVRPFRAILGTSDTPAVQIPDRTGRKNLYSSIREVYNSHNFQLHFRI